MYHMGDRYISDMKHIYPRKLAPVDSASFFRPDTYDTCHLSKVSGAVDPSDAKFADMRINAICEFDFPRLPNNVAMVSTPPTYSAQSILRYTDWFQGIDVDPKRDAFISNTTHIYPLKPLAIDSASFFTPDTYDTCQLSRNPGAVHASVGII